MKILYYSRPSFTDTDIDLLKSLKEQGHEVCYVLKIAKPYIKSTLINIKELYTKTGVFKYNIYPELEWIQKYTGCDFYVSNVVKYKSRGINFNELYSLQKLVWSFSPDVIHFIGTSNITELTFHVLNRKKLVTTIHDPLPHSGEYSRKAELLKKLALKISPKIILLNSKQTNEFCHTYRIKPGKIYFSSFGYLNWMQSFATTTNKKEPYVLFYGRVSPYKGIEYLLEAAPKIKEKYKDFRLVVAGSGKYYFDIEPFKKLDYVSIINRYIETDELANLICNSALVICPYTDATQSGVVSSVLALNKPIIVSNVGALPEMVDNGITGLVIPPKDTAAIERSISELWGDMGLLNTMETNIKTSSVHGKYSWSAIANHTVEIYKA